MFASRTADRGSIPGQVIPKTEKKVLDTNLLHTDHYKICIKGKVEQYKENTSAFAYTTV